MQSCIKLLKIELEEKLALVNVQLENLQKTSLSYESESKINVKTNLKINYVS